MFRLSQLLKITMNSAASNGRRPHAAPDGPVVIWNVTKACNLTCMHCYSSSLAKTFPGELTTEEALRVIGDLKRAGVTMLIVSGGEPLMRRDIMDLAAHAKENGIMASLSTNGTLIDGARAEAIRRAGFDYVGVSIDGSPATHDRFRGCAGSHRRAVKGVLRLKEMGVKVGVRCTLTRLTVGGLPDVFAFVERHGIDKLYLSHLVYAGRGGDNRAEDLSPKELRGVMEEVIEQAETWRVQGAPTQIVTGNNDADGLFLYLWLLNRRRGAAGRLLRRLDKTGGNSAGVGVVNIDSQGYVHPDPLMQEVTLGNVKQSPFGDIWSGSDHPVLRALRKRPRPVQGRCAECAWLTACGGNNRARAFQITGDVWAADPACYLTDEEIRCEVSCAL